MPSPYVAFLVLPIPACVEQSHHPCHLPPCLVYHRAPSHQNTDPHYEMILYSLMLTYGRRNSSFLRSQKRWQCLLPLLMDHVRLEVDPEVDDGFYGAASAPTPGSSRQLAVPIEAKLRSLSVRLLYEVCRVQKMSLQDLREFFLDLPCSKNS